LEVFGAGIVSQDGIVFSGETNFGDLVARFNNLEISRSALLWYRLPVNTVAVLVELAKFRQCFERPVVGDLPSSLMGKVNDGEKIRLFPLFSHAVCLICNR